MANGAVEKAADLSKITRPLGFLTLALFVVAGLFAARPAAADARQSFFGSVEFASADTEPFTKWRDALARTAREVAGEHGRDCGKAGADCPYRALDAFLETLRGKSRPEQLAAVNAYMNRRPYVTDARNWGRNDYWATPAEFLARSGDCEDYAIAKFFALKRLGWKAEDLRLAAVKDLDQNTGHAVLVVFADGRSWLLDNQIGEVVATDGVRRYEPVYSINEHAWWRHRVVAPTPAAGVDTASGR